MPEPSAGAWRLPMAKPDPLDRLARSHGVAGTYVDTGGRTITASAETKRAVLAAMGIPVGTATAEMAGGADVLPPVVILDRRPGPQRVPIGRRSARWATPTAWHLEREDGTCLEGRTTLRGGALELPGRDLPLGYHQLILTGRGRAAATTLIVAPRRCFLPASARQWGVAMQLYGVRSARNWGIGDFADLGVLAEAAAAEGASCVGINPVHALLTPASGSVSPYSPSSRSFLNALYIAPDGVPELADSAEARAMVAAVAPCLAALRDASLVDHAGVATAKAPVLAALHQAFDERRRRDPGNPRARAFAAFVAAGGAALTRFVTFEALAEVMSAEQDGSHDWREWPARYRRPDAPAVRAFAAANPERLDFHRYLQWLADTQLGEAARRATAAGMPVGLYCDVAVGVHPGGAEAWAEQGLIAAGVSIGAPPDAYNAEGQDWGLAPLNPSGLRAQAYRPFAEVLAANMRHAGALRIDHVMGCMRLFWVPEGQPPTAGTYVAYPFDDLVRIGALESVRQRCVVIGEDLGTVPPGLRARLRRRPPSRPTICRPRAASGLRATWSGGPAWDSMPIATTRQLRGRTPRRRSSRRCGVPGCCPATTLPARWVRRCAVRCIAIWRGRPAGSCSCSWRTCWTSSSRPTCSPARWRWPAPATTFSTIPASAGCSWAAEPHSGHRGAPPLRRRRSSPRAVPA